MKGDMPMNGNGNGLKWLGIGLTIIGAIIGIASTIVGNKQQEIAIRDSVHEEVKNQLSLMDMCNKS